MSLIDEAIEALKAKSIEKPRVVPPPSQAQISHAEKTLGLKFPPSYLAFLNNTGSFALSYWETYWVGDTTLGYRDIVEANRSEHNDTEPALPAFLITFHNNGCGDQLCFDTRKHDRDGEYPIVFWDHELTSEENLQDLSPVAVNFAHWLMKEVDEHS